MNEKIRELFHQAYGYPIDVVGEQAEKFAELIVLDVHQYVDSMDTAQIISTGILRRYGMIA